MSALTAQIGAARAPRLALSVTLLVQTLAAVTLSVPSVIAPVMAPALGLPAQNVGWLISGIYLMAMLSGLNGGALVQRHGAIRLSQWALLGCTLCLVLLAVGHPVALMAAALAMGVGYGLPNPTAADILSRHAPPDRRGLFFSIKQTGVPLGVAFGGLIVPALLSLTDWRTTLLVMAAPLLCITLGLGAARGALQVTTESARHTGGTSIAEVLRTRLVVPLRDVLVFAPTRKLALVSLVYAFTQVSFLTFLVSLLKLEHGHPLALAAGLLSASQAVSVVARIGWGHVSDRWLDPTILMGVLGLLMAGGIALLGLLPPSTPWPLTLLVTMFCAATVVSWNGVFYADLVRHVPPSAVAQATGATQFMTFLGGMTGGGVFAWLVGRTGSFASVYAAVAVLPAIAGVLMLLSARRTQPSNGTPT